jgi:4'-phosphopantetheinyl transferase
MDKGYLNMTATEPGDVFGSQLQTPDEISLQQNEVHIWAVALDNTEHLQNLFKEQLSSDETERAARYRFDLHRQRFICGRAVLRLLLAQYTGTPAAKIQFRYGPNGKPSLSDSNGTMLHFNVSHCDDLALIAFGRSCDLGVDIERIRWLDDFDELVERFFSPRESACFGSLAAELKPVAFFNLWTRKEALLKATGDGICSSLNRVEVTFLPNEPARLLALPENGVVSEWTLCELAPAAGYAAAVAIRPEGRAPRVPIQTDIRLKSWKFIPEGCSTI